MSQKNEELERPLALPVFTIETVKVTLERDGVIYAHLLELVWASRGGEIIIPVRERRFLPVKEFRDSKFEGVLQVCKGMIVSGKELENVKNEKKYISGTFRSFTDSYLFFPELVDFMNAQVEEYDEVQYDYLAEIAFSDYSKHGFGIGPYESVLVVETENGAFLLNEYVFEEMIEELLPGDQVAVQIEEALLLSMTNPRDYARVP